MGEQVEDKIPFEITFTTDSEDTLPKVGTLAVGLGAITSLDGGVTARLQVVEDGIPHQPKLGSARKGPSASSKWWSAWNTKKKPASTASTGSGTNPSASSSASTTASMTPKATSWMLTTKNSYSASLDFRMRWTVEEAPIVGGIYSTCVWVAKKAKGGAPP
ncbi:hypothetical protein CF319_g8232 [Tilletia indica]|nr:hypothetical protein CF319_g8232 [Tilletia indica]